MELTQIIQPSAVKFLHGVSSKKRLFQSISEIAAPLCAAKQDVIVQALMERENLGPTGVGNGVALPHARLEDATSVFGCFIRLEKAIDYSSVDRQPVDLVFALFAPEDAGVQHLKALAAVSRTLRNPEICEKLRSNVDPATLYEILAGSALVTAAA
ncbi:MAG: PTS sugar transporter subunit IIA [Planktomarina sp.]